MAEILLTQILTLGFMWIALRVICTPFPSLTKALKKVEKDVPKFCWEKLWWVMEGIGDGVCALLDSFCLSIISRRLNRKLAGFLFVSLVFALYFR